LPSSITDIVSQVCQVRKVPILLQKSAVTDDVVRPFHLGRRGLVPRPRRTLSNFYATQYTEPQRVAVAQPAMRAAVGSEQWRPEQTRPERLVDHAVETDRASECASSARTASRSSCAHVAIARSLGASERPGNVSSVRMDVARDLARWFLWAALRFEWAYIAVELAGTIQKRLALVHGAARSEPLSARAMVDVACRII
jgi:hypothetical protein